MVEADGGLTVYMNGAIKELISDILNSGVRNPREALFLLRFLLSQKRAGRVRLRSERAGLHIPVFLICSITNSCNLFCTGCYARANGICSSKLGKKPLSAREWRGVFAQAADAGSAFSLLAGGEPLLAKDVIMAAAREKRMIFPVFTNGTLIDADCIKIFKRHRNLVPVLSLEGGQGATDARRGAGVYRALCEKMRALGGNKILYGVSLTVSSENLDEVTSEAFLDTLENSRCKIVFFIEYVPIDPEKRGIAPTQAERAVLEERLSRLKARYPGMVFLSFPGDEKMLGGCLAAGRGFFHISPYGDAEACPFSPYSDLNLRDKSFTDVLRSPLFEKLREKGLFGGEHDGGCALFEREDEVNAVFAELNGQNGRGAQDLTQ